MDYAIHAKNITKFFKFAQSSNLKNLNEILQKKNSILALDDISFKISKGEAIGIIGLNGSGKTTLLRVLSGIYTPSFGSVQTNGKIAPLLQIGVGFQPELNAIENIRVYGLLLGLSKIQIEQKTTKIIEYSELENFKKMKLKHFSTGMRTRLAFSTALQIDPDILLIDEILSVGDIAFREKSFKEFLSFKKRGKTILFTTHNTNMISQHSDRVFLLDKGKLIIQGTPQEVIPKYEELALKKQI